MAEPSITSMSSAQAAGQSCGQVECRMSILGCWFMTHCYHQKRTAPSAFICHALCAKIGTTIGVDGLAINIARRGAAQEPHRGGDMFRLAALARDGLVRKMMRRFRLVLR